jgi:hypothetical protein
LRASQDSAFSAGGCFAGCFSIKKSSGLTLGSWLESISKEGNQMALVLKYLALFTMILKRGESCPQVKAVVAALESTAETVVEKTLTTNLQALAEKYPDKAAEIAAVGEIIGHITNPAPA